MSNIDKYNEIFVEALNLPLEEVKSAKFKETRQWDSVGHVNLISKIEETFDISLDPDDLMDLTSYDAGLQILPKYEIAF